MIESSYMKIGKSPVGVIGFTTSSATMSVWAKSMHAQTSYLNQFFSCGGQEELEQKTHKMESKGRIFSDESDRSKLRCFLADCIHPLDVDCHAENRLCNIVTGEVADNNVNVNESVQRGIESMKEFERKLPQGFKNPISSTVRTMTEVKKESIPKEKKSIAQSLYSHGSAFS